jgi:hypothetical protein
MSNRQYWVVGGEYRDTSFRELCEGCAQAVGPFADYDQALRVWRERSVASRPQPHVRYTIAVNTAA